MIQLLFINFLIDAKKKISMPQELISGLEWLSTVLASWNY